MHTAIMYSNEEAPGWGEEEPKNMIETDEQWEGPEIFYTALSPTAHILGCSEMQKEKPGMVALTCNLSIQEARRSPGIKDQPGIYHKFHLG